MSKKNYVKLKIDLHTAKELKRLCMLTDGDTSKQGRSYTVSALIDDAIFDIENKVEQALNHNFENKKTLREEREIDLKAFAKAQYPDDGLIDHLRIQELTLYLMRKSILSSSEIEKLCKMGNQFYSELGKHIDLTSYLKDVMGEKENEDNNEFNLGLIETK